MSVREHWINVRVNPEELARIREKQKELGIRNTGAYMRKMAMDGYCVNLDLSDVAQVSTLLRRCSNNLNQYAKRANETGSIYAEDIRDLQRRLDELWQMQRVMNQQVPDTEALPQEETGGMDTETVAVTASASGIDETDNLAQDGDVHKVYLTFDDGPSENTDAILDVLSEYDVKATFFVVGKEDEASAAIYQRIVDEGHTLGMHSYSNKYSLIYQSEDAFEADFHQLQDYLYEVTGEKSRYYRFPGGSSNQISNVPMSSLIRFLNSEDVVYYDWNVSAGDAANAAYTPEELVENVVSDVSKYKTSVVLLHDSEDKSTTVEAVEPLIEALQDMDAEILPIDEDTQVIQYVKADSAR